jgi:hypothetical protein
MEYVAGSLPVEVLCIMQLVLQTICIRTRRYRGALISGQEIAAIAKCSLDFFCTKFVNTTLGVLDALIHLTTPVLRFFGDGPVPDDIGIVYETGKFNDFLPVKKF